MKKALTRLWQWVYHPSIRHQSLPRGKALQYRYPSPGSSVGPQTPNDYRRPFSTSQYNVRHNYGLTHAQSEPGVSTSAMLSSDISITKKLVVLGLLKKNQVNNQQAVAQATKKYEKYYGQINSNVLRNDFGIPEVNPSDRESIRQAIAQTLAVQSIEYQQNKFQADDAIKNDPDVYHPQSLDLYASAHFQQSRIQNQYALQEIANENAQGIDVNRGDARFWKALDDTNDPQNIKKVQQKVGDQNPLMYELRRGKVEMEMDKDGNVIDLHRKD